MKDVELNITALNASATHDKNYVVVLQEANGQRRLPVVIGLNEANAIAVALEQLQLVRPLTHDLFLNTLSLLKAKLQHVKITEISNGICMSVIVLKDEDQNILEIDSRASDAIALAARQQCSILINDELLSREAAQEPEGYKLFADKVGNIRQFSLIELYELLTDLLQKEDYESAGIVRDIISKKERK